ncbi:WbqC family protein [Campylobacter sp. 2018MI35]|uniref:WbqC family protein n=1 Tax=Campylobacter sp. 2018MI34 TaxID=2800582 RepID=UPI001905C285|nr:WbqC family protein [Campylobacter sp. 2018MI34]MBK1992419.1 WbqC family protein [Campylobacter sp. 2018MI34]
MIAIMQPTFLPWIGYFCMIAKVKYFVFLDNVQFEQRSWQSRNKIKLQEKEHFISLSHQKTSQKTLICDIKLSKDTKWKDKILKTFYHAYSKSDNFNLIFDSLKYNLNKHENLCELNISLINAICKILEINTPLFRSSMLDLSDLKRENLLVAICKKLDAKDYLSANGSKIYLDKEEAKKLFKDNEINISYFDFTHPIYKQNLNKRGGGFIPYLSVVDFLCSVKDPREEFKKILRKN